MDFFVFDEDEIIELCAKAMYHRHKSISAHAPDKWDDVVDSAKRKWRQKAIEFLGDEMNNLDLSDSSRIS